MGGSVKRGNVHSPSVPGEYYGLGGRGRGQEGKRGTHSPSKGYSRLQVEERKREGGGK